MKISMIAPETRTVPPVLGGGVETWIYETSKRLAPNYIYVICPKAHLPAVEISNNVIYIRTKLRPIIPLINAFATRFIPSIYCYPYNRTAQSICEKLKPDIIHLHNRPQFLEIFHNLRTSKIILHMHNQIKPYLPVINRLAVNLLDKADAIIVVSKYLKEVILESFPQIDPQKMHVLYNGADIERFRPRKEDDLMHIKHKYGISANTKVILYVGRLIPEKGVHLLVDSFPMIKKNYDNVKLIIVGGANFAIPSETNYVKLLKTKANNDIIFTGWVSFDMLPLLYALSHVFVFPAIWEDVSPLPIYEAQASGIPVVGSNRGGIPEVVINNQTGIVVEPSVENIANAVLDLLHDESKRKKMAILARRRAEEYLSWNRVAVELQKIYKQCLAS